MKIGIDLGTTYSLAAHIERDGIPALIPDIHFRKNSTPSTVCLGNGSALVGWQAEGKFEQSPEQVRLLSFFKRQFGNPEPFAIDPAGNAWHPEALAALVLKKLRNDAEKQIGSKLQGAVLTVPAHFNDLQRRSTQVAAAMADIPLLGLLDEPVAAALHYGVANTSAGKEQIFFVYDLGGGTFDATVLSYHPQAGIDVLAQDGHTNLGGREFDEILQTYIAQQIGESFHWSAYALLQLRKAAEEVKIEFSDPAKFFIRKTILIGHWHKEITFSRREFEEQARTLLQQTVEISRRCLFECQNSHRTNRCFPAGRWFLHDARRAATIGGRLGYRPRKSETSSAIACGGFWRRYPRRAIERARPIICAPGRLSRCNGLSRRFPLDQSDHRAVAGGCADTQERIAQQ
jgi:molecular chaperone DnaK (HSP70)